MEDKTEKVKEYRIQIRYYNAGIYDHLKNIAKNTGITLSSLIKTHLRSIVDSYPEHMKKPNKGLNIKD